MAAWLTKVLSSWLSTGLAVVATAEELEVAGGLVWAKEAGEATNPIAMTAVVVNERNMTITPDLEPRLLNRGHCTQFLSRTKSGRDTIASRCVTALLCRTT
jgi:hypothetical protein